MYNKLILITFFLVTSAISAAPAKNALSDVISAYRKSELVTIEMVKTVKSNLLGKETKFKGFIYLAANKFRLDIDEPEKNSVIFDGNTIWNVQPPPKELPGPVQVAKSKLDQNSKKQILISTLISRNGISDNFKIEKTDNKSDIKKYFLSPTKSDITLKNLEVNIKDKKIYSIIYTDDVGNLTTYEFQKTTFSSKSKAKSKLFKYKPPKGALVTNL